MIRAREAKFYSDRYLIDQIDNELSGVYSQIEKDAKIGHEDTCYFMGDNLKDEHIYRLKELGYAVKRRFTSGETWLYISWEMPTDEN